MIYELVNEITDSEHLSLLINLEQKRKAFVSNSVKDILGYDVIKFIDINFKNIIHPEDEFLVQKAFLQAINKNEVVEVSYRIKHQKGQWVNLSAQCKPFMIKGSPKYMLLKVKELKNELRLTI